MDKVTGKMCASCGAAGTIGFSGRSFSVGYVQRSATLRNLSGWECESCHEIVFDPDGARRYSEAGDRLLQDERDEQRLDLRSIREKLNLTRPRV